MFLIDGRIFLFIMETARSGISPTGDADAGGTGRYAVRSPVSPSSVAGATPSPPGGRLLSVVRILFGLLLNLTDKSALSLYFAKNRSSLPPGGEGGAPAPDEGEIGEWNHRNICSPCRPRVGKKNCKQFGAKRRMRAKSASAITNRPASHPHPHPANNKKTGNFAKALDK